MGEPTEKTRWNAKVEALRLHGALVGLASRFEANDLDSGPVKKASAALSKVAEEVQTKLDEEALAQAKYHQATGPGAGPVEELRRENEELKRRLAASAVR